MAGDMGFCAQTWKHYPTTVHTDGCMQKADLLPLCGQQCSMNRHCHKTHWAAANIAAPGVIGRAPRVGAVLRAICTMGQDCLLSQQLHASKQQWRRHCTVLSIHAHKMQLLGSLSPGHVCSCCSCKTLPLHV